MYIEIFVFASKTAANIQIGYERRLWAVSQDQANNGSTRGKARKLMPGDLGVLWCKETQSLKVPFKVTSMPDFFQTVSGVWPEVWELPFEIEPLASPARPISKRSFGHFFPKTIAKTPLNWSHSILVAPTTIFAASRFVEEEWLHALDYFQNPP